MALLSDVDWIILLAVAVFLLFGRQNRDVLRTLGRWYARAGRVKQELLGEFSRATDLPLPGPGAPLTLRGTILGIDPAPTRASGIPAAVRTPPTAPGPSPAGPAPLGSYEYPGSTWTMTASLELPTSGGRRP